MQGTYEPRHEKTYDITKAQTSCVVFCKADQCLRFCFIDNMSRDVIKPDFCICENKDADQLCGNREADQCLCFRYTESTTPLLPKYKISSL